jgi:hypothetical protein
MLQLNSPTEASTENVVATNRESAWAVLPDWAIACCVALVIAAIFAGTFCGANVVSHFADLGILDSIYNCNSRTWLFRPAFDPCVYSLYVPVREFIRNSFSTNVLPLWNPLCGAGYPLIGDPQSFLFSPLQFVFPFQNQSMYNLGIVVKPVIGAVATYCLARSMSISRFASAFAASSFALCPYLLRYEELPLQGSLLPLLFLVMRNSVLRSNFSSGVIAALTLALFITFTHSGTFVYGTLFATLFAFCSRTTRGAAIRLSWILLLAIAFAAPVLFPTFEYLLNADCYKSAVQNLSSRPVAIFTLLLNLINPAFGGEIAGGEALGTGVGSPFLGILAGLSFFVGLFLQDKNAPALRITMLAALLFITGLDAGIVTAYLQPIYAIPSFLLFAALLAGIGIDEMDKVKPALLILCLPGLVSVLQFPLSSFHLDGSMRSMVFNSEAYVRDLVIVSAFIAIVLLIRMVRLPKQIAILSAIVLNFVSVASSGAMALPAQPQFAPKLPHSLEIIGNSESRFIACGPHLCLPNTNCLFAIQDLRHDNPLTPKGYVQFITAAGAHREGLYSWRFENTVNHLCDLASVKYVLSDAPVRHEDDPSPVLEPVAALKTASLVVASGLRLDEAAAGIDQVDRSIWCKFTWKIHACANGAFEMQPVLLSTGREILWQGDRRILSCDDTVEHTKVANCSFAIPQSVIHGQNISAAVRFFDSNTGATVSPEYSPLELVNGTVIVKQFQLEAQSKKSEKHRKLRLVRCDGRGLRLYENRAALSSAYFESNSAPNPTVHLDARRPDANHFTVRLTAPQQGRVVMSETWYPGWQATLDGVPVPILRTNYLFRAVEVPPGPHEINLSYEPESFRWGVYMFIAAAFAVFAYAVRRRISAK